MSRREQRHTAPPGAVLLGVEGATLGGSWKTPVSLALAEALARRGATVGFWSRGYRRERAGWSWVTPETPREEAGDEALLAFRRLAPLGIPVAVGAPEGALPALARRGGVIVADSLRVANSAQSRALLALDEASPWGAGVCPPAGDLRAPSAYLLASAAAVMLVGNRTAAPQEDGWWRGTRRLDAERLEGRRVAVVTAVARPERFAKGLREAGVQVLQHVALPDHGGPGVAAEAARRLQGSPAEAIACTEKCAVWLPGELGGKPVEAISVRIELPAGLPEALLGGIPDAWRMGIGFTRGGC